MRGRRSTISTTMFGPALVKGIDAARFEEDAANLPDALTPYFEADRRENGYRESGGPRFEPVYTGEVVTVPADGYMPEHEEPVVEVRCPICASIDVREESFSSYGGTTEGYAECDFCGYSRGWADISAVI